MVLDPLEMAYMKACRMTYGDDYFDPNSDAQINIPYVPALEPVDIESLSNTGKRFEYWRRNAELLQFKNTPMASFDAENAVLSTIMGTHGKNIPEVTFKLGEYDFYQEIAQLTFRCCVDLHERGLDVSLPAVYMELRQKHRQRTEKCTEYLGNLIRYAIFPGDVQEYVKIVKELSLLRQLIIFCGRTIYEAYKPGSTFLEKVERVGKVLGALARMGYVDQPASSLQDVMSDLHSKIELAKANPQVVTGVSTGFRQLDYLLSGLQKTDLIILAARPGMGKTAFALNIAVNAAKAGFPVLFFSLEMGKMQLAQRVLASEAQVNLMYLRSLRNLSDLTVDEMYRAEDRLNQLPLYIDDTPSITLLELKTRAQLMQVERGIKLIVVDYLQLMRGSYQKNYNRELEISEISRTLKALAKELDIPVVALAQLNRKVEERGTKRPMLSDLRESGAIEQDADVIMFIYRDDMYKDEGEDKDNKADIIVAKHRNGAQGEVHLLYKPEYTTFHDLEEKNYVEG